MATFFLILNILLAARKWLPVVTDLFKTGAFTVEEVAKLVEWFARHKRKGAKTMYVVPAPAVNMEVLKPQPIPAPAPLPTYVPNEDLERLENPTYDVPDYLKKYE